MRLAYHPPVVKRSVRKRLAPATALAAVAVAASLLSGCNASASPYAARVGDATISATTLDDMLSGIQASHGYRCLFTGGAKLTGVGSDTWSTTYVRFVLTNLIQAEIAEQQAALRHLSEPGWLSGVAASQLQQSITQGLTQAPTCGSARSVWSGLDSSYRSSLIRYQMAEDVLAASLEGASLSPGGLASFAASHPSLSEQVCLSVIQVRSKALALSLRTAIAKGRASFASEARKHSIDSTSASAGGAIGCITTSQLVSPLGPVVAALQTGTVSSPQPFQSTYVLLEVTSRSRLSDTALVSAIFAAARQPFSNVVSKAARTEQISVDPQYGTWSPRSGQVAAPKSPAARYVPNLGAVTGTTQATTPSLPARP